MALRFRKRVKIAPGIGINLSWSEKKGVTTSATVGVPGANVNVGTKKDGTIGVKHGTLGIPGSGLSHHTNLQKGEKHNKDSQIEDGKARKEELNDAELDCHEDATESLSLLQVFAHHSVINWCINIAIIVALYFINA